MIIFLDENDVEYGALATIKATNAVNGERSITGEITSGDVVLSRIERGWRLRFEDEYYVVTYAKPIDEGKNVQVSFDAVHQFFWDFGKSSVYDQLSDGSHTFRAYLDFIFNSSGYRYDIESSLTVKAFEKQSFGYKNRLSLFNDVITSSGVEFQVNGKVVRILAKVGTDLSTVVRKNFNLNELGIEKNIGDFVTYQKGFGAYFDEEDHSKGRLIAEYTSPLASVYGKLEADPLVDERYKQQASLLSALKETVDNSYTISVSLDMEDLTRAGYRYTQPVAGDYIMAINETLGFKEKIRIVSFTSEYDVTGQLIKHTVTCNDIGSVKKLSASYTQTQHQAANAEINANTAYEFANKALVSANGKNTNYYGDTFPVDNPKGTLKKGDLLFLTVGDTVKQYYWNGAEWVTNPVVSDVEAFKEQIAEELKDVPNREEFENKIAEEVANSKAEIETQIETAKMQAESNAKEYADTINQETAKVAELANAAAGEIKADLVNVKDNLTATSLVANNAQAAVDGVVLDLIEVTSDLNTAKQDLTNSVAEVNTKVDSTKAELTQAKQDLASSVTAVNGKVDSAKADLTQAKQDLMSHAQQLQTQANAQTELTKRVTTVETTANGTKTTVNELTKTVAQNGKDITSVTNRTKTVEDDLANTKTTLTQVQTTANSASQKTATLETGLNGLSAKFDSLKIGGRNLLVKTNQGKTNWSWRISSGGTTAEDYNVDGVNAVKLTRTSDASYTWHYIQYDGLIRKLIEPDTKYTLSFDVKPSVDVTFTATLMIGDGRAQLTDSVRMNKATANKWTKVSCVLTSKTTLPDDLGQVVYLSNMPVATGNWLIIKNIKLEKGNVATDYSPSEIDLEQKVAEYKQNADQNYASLQSTVQNLDGTVQHNKTVADQTAEGFKTRIESLETYKDGESTRANQYFELAKTETARQLTVERTAIAKDYVAKSTYTSDVTGIRNELSATTITANTTKQNLASYQASNDKVVANLQSNIQTANGDISSLKTKVEAVPGQITSAVSAVESKIPTSLGVRNLLSKTNQGKTNWTWAISSGGGTAENYDADGVNAVKLTRTSDASFTWHYIAYWGLLRNLIEPNTKYTLSFDVKPSVDVTFWASLKRSDGGAPLTDAVNMNKALANQWTKVSCVLATTSTLSDDLSQVVYLSGMPVATGNWLIIKNIKLEEGVVSSDWQPAPEDAIKEISSLSSQIKQTADGMTLLATKTELNSAKNELQSGIKTATDKANNNAQTISTHTTQISALNTGLNAKVSQSDFNTLSGRVTTAENNIIAKANELSSKITSVESKIPTEIGAVNLFKGSRDFSGAGWVNNGNGVYTEDYQGVKIFKTNIAWLGRSQYFEVKTGEEYVFSAYVKSSAETDRVTFYLSHSSKEPQAQGWVGFETADSWGAVSIDLTDEYKRIAIKIKITKDGWIMPRLERSNSDAYLFFGGYKLERGNIATDWTPAPEDTAEQISSLSSEIKQTADGMTLLATKTEVNSAKSELQSGITTATNKANNAQSTANNNAQTISTHTTQISALNTGLSAKVSQTDFNTLSGRVTTAENNITAKANELSSKITSVEGKIPTSIGGRNLLSKTNQGKTNWTWAISSGGGTAENYDADGVNAVKLTRTSDASFTWHYIAYWGLLRNLIEPNTKYTLSFDVKPSVDVTFTASLKRGDGGAPLTNAAAMNKATANKWTKVSCILTSTTTLSDDLSQVVYLSDMPVATGNWLIIKNIKLEEGVVSSDWSPAPEDYDSKLSTMQSEFKQTTDSIKASVQSLDNNTVKSSSLTINSDGVVIKAGKSTSDFANAVGSYFSVNQNAINLFSDKINVKGNMIVSGAITSDKIASKQINTSHLNGKIITADVISSNAVTADAIRAGAVTTDKMSANSINGDRITAGTLDAAKIRAGSITASQIASGTITSAQIKTGTISAANIAAGAITSDKIAANSIDASKIAANAITANMITGGQLRSTNGATMFDLNAGTLTFNNNYGYIQRVANDKIFAITTSLSNTSDPSQEYLTSAFNIRKSDNSRYAGIKFSLYNNIGNKPIANAKMNADEFILYDSKNTEIFSVCGKGSWLGNFNTQGWGDIPVVSLRNGGLLVKDIGIGGHMKSLLKIVEELCNKTGIMWI